MTDERRAGEQAGESKENWKLASAREGSARKRFEDLMVGNWERPYSYPVRGVEVSDLRMVLEVFEDSIRDYDEWKRRAEQAEARWEKLKAGGEKREAGNRKQDEEWERKKHPHFVPYHGCYGQFADEDKHWLAAMREIEQRHTGEGK